MPAGAWQTCPLPRASWQALSEGVFFSESQTCSSRPRKWPTQHYVEWCFSESRNFAESWFSAKIQLCRESFFAEGRALSIQHVAKRFPSPRVTLCRDRLCRVPDIWRSAKKFSLGEEPVSGSDLSSTVMWHITFYSSLHSCSDLSITEDHEHSRNGGWSLIWMVAPQWWVIDNIVWTDSWSSTTSVGCGLVCVVAGEEQVWKVLAKVASGWWRDK
jgi:hypothetical protein